MTCMVRMYAREKCVFLHVEGDYFCHYGSSVIAQFDRDKKTLYVVDGIESILGGKERLTEFKQWVCSQDGLRRIPKIETVRPIVLLARIAVRIQLAYVGVTYLRRRLKDALEKNPDQPELQALSDHWTEMVRRTSMQLADDYTKTHDLLRKA